MPNEQQITYEAGLNLEKKTAIFKVVSVNGIDIVEDSPSEYPWDIVLLAAAHIMLTQVNAIQPKIIQ